MNTQKLHAAQLNISMEEMCSESLIFLLFSRHSFWIFFHFFSKIGHFTQIVKDDALVIGCAISVYHNGNWNNYLMACNYGKTNILNRPIYSSGMPTSECVTGRDGIYQNLCS